MMRTTQSESLLLIFILRRCSLNTFLKHQIKVVFIGYSMYVFIHTHLGVVHNGAKCFIKSNLNAYKNYLGSVDNFGKRFEKI